jgi:D-alanyl-D-alanine-carboxypeptidase/D-alanyl-D-alanine-endopeptidase
VWVELLMALLVEGYRELVEWWQLRAPWRRAAADSAADLEAGSRDRAGAPALDRTAELESAVEDLLDRHAGKHVGIALGVYREGETWTFARGRIGPERPRPAADTIFEIGSITKVVTATLLADMAAEGLVALNDPVQRYLPADVRLPVRGRPITLADLASQASGLPRLPKGLIAVSLRERRNPYASFAEEHLHRAVSATRLRADPGRKVRYSNFGFGLLGHVLARRAGTTYEALVLERICEPLGLDDTRISIPRHALSRFADGHDRRGRVVPHWDLPALAGAGALRSTVADMLVFLELNLRPPATRLARAAHATHEERARRGPLIQGLGWAALPLRGSSYPVRWHHGGTGGFRSFAGFVRESSTGVVVLSNSARSVDAIGFRVLEAMN